VQVTDPVEKFNAVAPVGADAVAQAPAPKTDAPKTETVPTTSSPTPTNAVLVEMKENGFSISTTPETAAPAAAPAVNKSGFKIDKQFITPIVKKETPGGVS
jgi:hypothetical protein